MEEKKYKELLKTAPKDHFSKEFVAFLEANNEVRFKNSNWLVVENIKYHDEENDWLTAFYIGSFKEDLKWALKQTEDLLARYGSREWLIKAPHKRTIELFHLHMYKK